MKIIVHDTATTMLDILSRPPAERPDALRELYAPLEGPLSVLGDFDPVQAHRMGSGFPLGDGSRADGSRADDPRLPDAVRRMREAGVWDRVADSLAAAWERIDAAAPGVRHAETVHVVIVLGDPDDHHLTVRSSGYFGLGGLPGALQLFMWPTDTSLRNIAHAAAHELHHNVRYANVAWNPAAVTVGEHVVAEGLAEAFARELAGEQGLGPWTRALTGDRLDDAYERITADVDVAGMGNVFPYVLGDDTARLMGQEPVGLPDFAGYAVGLRIVEAHMAATGLTAAQSVALPASEILRNAGVPTKA
ncbi:DUF2268 domain-containing protein [Streptomyces huiliensis]|uniref:DUF2268 domain-containing protein n=1 Tax=Streptomyces huiliensis TaxID=2876027 RepID=UPI001CC1AD6C|nr:DUF2268 domain-containing putative Zn-dependent protease [Streptomyces huiliensis]MBZ4321323.1 DUF2268 domain-containing protein [Streptomyces huiliensis]